MKPVSISLNPNVENNDVTLALGLLFQPWKWKQGKTIKSIEEKPEHPKSDLVSTGVLVLNSDIFKYLKSKPRDNTCTYKCPVGVGRTSGDSKCAHQNGEEKNDDETATEET